MEKVLNTLRSLNNANDLLQQLGARDNFIDKFATTQELAITLYDQLCPDEDVIILTYVLLKAYELSASKEEQEMLFDRTALLFKKGNWDSEIVLKIFSQVSVLSRTFTDQAISTERASFAVQPLFNVLKALCTPLSEFTTIHVDFILTCLIAKQYPYAKMVLLEHTTKVKHIQKDLQNISHELMRYFYYGGRVFTGLKDFKSAQFFFKCCITLPANGLSSVSIESYKYYVIVSLILYGKVEQPSTSINAHKIKLHSFYQEFTEYYEHLDISEAENLVNKSVKTLEAHGTFGLIKQSLRALKKRIILSLTCTYITTSLDEIVNIASLDNIVDAENLLLEMVESHELDVAIDTLNGVVEFKDCQPATTDEIALDLQDQLEKLMSQIRKLKAINDDLLVSRNYVKKITQRNNNPVDHPGANSMDVAFAE